MVEPGEQPADTIVREVHEETGVDVAVERVLGVATHPVDYPNGDRCEYLSITFLCRAAGGTARVNDDESLDVGWFEPTELPELEPYSRLRVEMALRDAKEAWFAPVGSRHPALVRRCDPVGGGVTRRPSVCAGPGASSAAGSAGSRAAGRCWVAR